MSLYCGYCHRLFSRVDIRIRHEKHSCQRKENPEDVPKIPFPTENQNRFPNEVEFGEAFRFKTPSSILVVGPSGCGKTCFTESLLLDHLEELFLSPLPKIHYCYGVWQDGFRDRKMLVCTFTKGFLRQNIQVVDSEGWITGVRRSDGRGR